MAHRMKKPKKAKGGPPKPITTKHPPGGSQTPGAKKAREKAAEKAKQKAKQKKRG